MAVKSDGPLSTFESSDVRGTALKTGELLPIEKTGVAETTVKFSRYVTKSPPILREAKVDPAAMDPARFLVIYAARLSIVEPADRLEASGTVFKRSRLLIVEPADMEPINAI